MRQIEALLWIIAFAVVSRPFDPIFGYPVLFIVGGILGFTTTRKP